MIKTLRHRGLAILALQWAPLAAGAQAPQIGQPAPDFTLETLDGGRLSLSDLKGHPVLVNFWASWCKPCRTEMPEIVAAYQQRLGTGLEVVAVNLSDQEQKKDVKRFVEELQMQVRVLLDVKGKVRERYRLVGLPTSIFIDSAGIVRVIHPGPMSREELDRGLAAILPGP